MARVYNFSAGPAVLPEEVLREAADEMLDYQGSGQSVMENTPSPVAPVPSSTALYSKQTTMLPDASTGPNKMTSAKPSTAH